MTAGELAVAFAVAVVIDGLFGEPPNRFHPVAWFGRLVAPLTVFAGRWSPRIELVAGFGLAIAAPLTWSALWMALLIAAEGWPWLHLLLAVFLIHSTFALRELGHAAQRMADALEGRRLEDARSGLSSLCSRDPSPLTEEQLAQGTIESVAENASDSVVAPLFYLALFGLPGALVYRAVNTLDAMIGYHGRFELFGKASARLDDALNWIPARLTAALLLAAGWFHGADVARGYRVAREHGARTESPNAGRPMAAMAGLLGVELSKPGGYTLGFPQHPTGPDEIRKSWRITRCALVAAAILTMIALCIRAPAEHV